MSDHLLRTPQFVRARCAESKHIYMYGQEIELWDSNWTPKMSRCSVVTHPKYHALAILRQKVRLTLVSVLDSFVITHLMHDEYIIIS